MHLGVDTLSHISYIKYIRATKPANTKEKKMFTVFKNDNKLSDFKNAGEAVLFIKNTALRDSVNNKYQLLNNKMGLNESEFYSFDLQLSAERA